MKVSKYERFSQNKGLFSLIAVLNGIQKGDWAPQINALLEALEAGDLDRAERIKKSLPAITFSATYQDARRLENLLTYNGLILLDIDGLEADQVDPIKWKASDLACTLFCGRSPRWRGLKIGVDPDDFGIPVRVENHKALFAAVAAYYEQELGIAVDPSGKDVGRLCFVSYDPDLYISDRLEAFIERRLAAAAATASAATVEPPAAAPAPSVPEGAAASPVAPDPEGPEAAASPAQSVSRLLAAARRVTNRRIKYEAGNRNNFIYQFAHNCKRRGIACDDVTDYCLRHFSDLDTSECQAAIHSAYSCPDEANREQADGKKGKEKVGVRPLEEYLSERYTMRRNRISGRMEIRKKKTKKPFDVLDDRMLHTLWCDMLNAGIKCRLKTLEALIYSHFVPEYDPFVDYFHSLPAWDGTTDYIGQLADTVTTTNQAFWQLCFRRWIVALVGCAIIPEVVNHTVLLLNGPQGVGKTSWCINLIPPALRNYIHSGPADPRSKDIRLALSECILVNLDELGALREQELNQLKEMTSTSYIRERRAYAREPETRARCCSFTASTNNGQVLSDITGGRRFLCFETLKIDYLVKIDYAGVYSQALALLQSGEKYWFDGEEIDILNHNNEPYRIQTPEEELFFTYFRLPRADDKEVILLSSAQIMQVLAHKAPVYLTRQSTQNLSMILKKEGFEQLRRHKRRVFRVVKLDEEEVERQRKGEAVEPDDAPKEDDNQGEISFEEEG